MLLGAVQELAVASRWVHERAANDPRQVGAASVEYLHLFGYMAYAYLSSKMASAAKANCDADFYLAK